MCQYYLYKKFMENFLNLLDCSVKNKGVAPENSTLFIREVSRTITNYRETTPNNTNYRLKILQNVLQSTSQHCCHSVVLQ